MTTTIEIRDRTDRFGRRLLTIDDSTARQLRAWIKDNWTEILGVGDGYSALIAPGHEWHPTVEALHRVAQSGGDRHPFIAGHSFGDEQADGDQPSSYDTLISTFGVRYHRGEGYSFGG